jgi:large subunit ribosomal protein L29
MQARELREMDDALLMQTLSDFRRDFFGLRFQHATGELENTSRLRQVKRDIARTLTVARERNLDVPAEMATTAASE